MPPTRRVRRASAALAASAIVLAACGADGGSTDDAAAGEVADVEAGTPDAAAGEGDGGGEPAVEALLPTHVDLVGEEVLPGAEIETNLLPPVVLDDLTTGRKVNFRNLVPQEQPILLWMWAPF